MTRALALLVFVWSAGAAGAPDPARALVVETLRSRAEVVGSRVEVSSVRWHLPRGCAPERVNPQAPLRTSGRVSLVVEGAGCRGVATAVVKVFAPVWVSTAPVEAGGRMEGRVTRKERELRPGMQPWLSEAPPQVAARALGVGVVVEEKHVRAVGPAAGESVRVVAQVGAVRIAQVGRVTPCAGPWICAQLPGGRRVEGRMREGELVVEVP
ncbi:MAG: hypothetical protein AB2A00_03885 [Myxococcota bacterium]